MKRRAYIKSTGIAAAGIAGISNPVYAGIHRNPEYDKYGGWTGKKFKATGFFRVEEDERWWMVTPEGHAFLSFGVNHFHLGFLQQDYHREQLRQVFGVEDMNNRKELWPAMRKWFLQTCKDFGFNTLGVHNNPLDELINHPQPALPYMQPIPFVDIPHWKNPLPDENFKDIFSLEFARECDSLARDIAGAKKDDPYLLAYSMTDCALFTEEDLRERTDTIGLEQRESARIGWPRRLRNMGGDAAGKKGYVATMTKLYEGSISKFNETYDTQFGSFEELQNAVNWRPGTELSNANETRDNIKFLQVCVDKYYQVARDAIRKYDPNHLFVGDKINANTDSLDTVLPVVQKYVDVLMYQMYARYEIQQVKLDRWAGKYNKPIINGDSGYSQVADGLPWPFGPIAATEEIRAQWTREFMEQAFARPEFIGWHNCGLMDTINLMPQKAERQHSGLVNIYGEPYRLVQNCMKSFSENMYQIATAG
jgi:hypothetical protein